MGRLDPVNPFMVMDILKEARAIGDVVHMEIGEPDLEPPPGVLEALQRAIREKRFFYTPSLGLWELRELIAQHYYEYYGVDISPSRVVITSGTSGAFLVAYAILMDAGHRVVLPDPSYPCYKNFAHILDINPLFVKVDKSTKYQIVPDHLSELGDFRVLHISSPSNPTGTLYDDDNLKAIAEYCQEKGIYLISDEIYHGLVYDRKERTALEFNDRSIVINGFSKAFCMPGFRLGWMVLPEDMVRKAELVLQNLYISAPTLSQYSALGAFDYNYLRRVREVYKERRDYLCKNLSHVFDIHLCPEGSFYIWACVERYGINASILSQKLLREAKVAVTPGVDFGSNNTEKHIRISFAKDGGTLIEGAKRIRDYLIR